MMKSTLSHTNLAQPATTTTTAEMSSIRITLKWSKQTFPMTIELGESALGFKQRIEALTSVPVSRQKLLAKGGWKGTLKDNAVLDALLLKRNTTSPSKNMVVTLIGSAETLSEPTQKTTFMEDLSPQDLEASEEAEAQAAMATAQGVIAAIQLPPHRRDDHKQELYQYNRLVTGLPQRQIEQELKYGQGASADGQLEGKVVMTLGLELRRAYVNDIIVLKDGTCVSALDDGHVQLWKHAAQHEDVVHQGVADGGVDSIVALNQKETAFATAGRGTLQFWTADGEPVASVRTAMPGTTPASLVEVPVMGDDEITCLAARFRVTRGTNPMQFRLPPQNDSERQRRAQAEAQEQAIQQALSGAARSVQVWFSIGQTKLQSRILEPSDGMEGSAVVTCLATLAGTDDRDPVLVVGDAAGGLRLWRVQRNNGTLEFNQQGLYQLLSPTSGCAVSCLKSLQDGRLAVSTGSSNEAANTHDLMGATKIEVPTARAVHILDFSYSAEPRVQTTLSGHTDEVITMCELPNGDLLTGGGKFDATLQLWSRSQLEPPTDSEGTAHEVTKSQKTLSNVGYVFALTVLPDAKNDSTYYAVAAARYNTVKVVI